MIATGIVRKLDTLGRVVILKKLRCMLEIGDETVLEILVDSDFIILQRYKPYCNVYSVIAQRKYIISKVNIFVWNVLKLYVKSSGKLQSLYR